MRRALSVPILVAMLLLSGNAMAQEQGKTTRAGIGFRLGWPIGVGPSLKIWFAPVVGIQGMGGRWSAGDVSITCLSGRFLLKLTQREDRVFPYLGVGAGTWITSGERLVYNPYSGFTLRKETENIFTFEALLGMQHKYAENFYGDYEVGYFVLEEWTWIDVQVSKMELAFGLHYFF